MGDSYRHGFLILLHTVSAKVQWVDCKALDAAIRFQDVRIASFFGLVNRYRLFGNMNFDFKFKELYIIAVRYIIGMRNIA